VVWRWCARLQGGYLGSRLAYIITGTQCHVDWQESRSVVEAEIETGYRMGQNVFTYVICKYNLFVLDAMRG
jgi:hypothetical protein